MTLKCTLISKRNQTHNVFVLYGSIYAISRKGKMIGMKNTGMIARAWRKRRDWLQRSSTENTLG